MIIKNITRNTTISKDLKIALSLIDRMFGLLLNRNPKSLLFKTRFGIHTFGLKEPIDVLVIGNDGRLIISKSLNPNKLFFYNPKYNTIVELPKGSINKSETAVGDITSVI